MSALADWLFSLELAVPLIAVSAALLVSLIVLLLR